MTVETNEVIQIIMDTAKNIYFASSKNATFSIIVKKRTRISSFNTPRFKHIDEITNTVDELEKQLKGMSKNIDVKTLPDAWQLCFSSGGILMESSCEMTAKNREYQSFAAMRLSGKDLPLTTFDGLQEQAERTLNALAQKMNVGEKLTLWTENPSVHLYMHHLQQAPGIEDLMLSFKNHKLPLSIERFKECAIVSNFYRSLFWINV